MIYNPPEIAQQRQSESKADNRSGGESKMSLLDRKGALKVAVKMEKVVPVCIQQLKMLLGVSSNEWVCTSTCGLLYTCRSMKLRKLSLIVNGEKGKINLLCMQYKISS